MTRDQVEQDRDSTEPTVVIDDGPVTVSATSGKTTTTPLEWSADHGVHNRHLQVGIVEGSDGKPIEWCRATVGREGPTLHLDPPDTVKGEIAATLKLWNAEPAIEQPLLIDVKRRCFEVDKVELSADNNGVHLDIGLRNCGNVNLKGRFTIFDGEGNLVHTFDGTLSAKGLDREVTIEGNPFDSSSDITIEFADEEGMLSRSATIEIPGDNSPPKPPSPPDPPPPPNPASPTSDPTGWFGQIAGGVGSSPLVVKLAAGALAVLVGGGLYSAGADSGYEDGVEEGRAAAAAGAEIADDESAAEAVDEAPQEDEGSGASDETPAASASSATIMPELTFSDGVVRASWTNDTDQEITLDGVGVIVDNQPGLESSDCDATLAPGATCTASTSLRLDDASHDFLLIWGEDGAQQLQLRTPEVEPRVDIAGGSLVIDQAAAQATLELDLEISAGSRVDPQVFSGDREDSLILGLGDNCSGRFELGGTCTSTYEIPLSDGSELIEPGVFGGRTIPFEIRVSEQPAPEFSVSQRSPLMLFNVQGGGDEDFGDATSTGVLRVVNDGANAAPPPHLSAEVFDSELIRWVPLVFGVENLPRELAPGESVDLLYTVRTGGTAGQAWDAIVERGDEGVLRLVVDGVPGAQTNWNIPELGVVAVLR